MFFIATADAEGKRTAPTRAATRGSSGCSTSGRSPFPNYDGNGMYLSMGNLLRNPHVGLLFIDFEHGHRTRLNGDASVDEADPLMAEYPEAQFIVRVTRPPGVPQLPALHPPLPARRAVEVRAPGRVPHPRARVEAHGLGQGRPARIRPGPRPRRAPGMSPATDPGLADELVDAVRTFVTKEVMPVASELEHADEYPTDLVEAMKGMGLLGCMIPEEYGGLGLDTVTYARIIEELSAGWMSLSGRAQHPHHGRHPAEAARHRRPEAAVAAAHGHGRDPRRALAVRARCRQRHAGAALQGHARRRRVRHQRHQDVGDQRRAGRHRGPGRPRARGHHLLHGREGAGAVVRRDHGVEDHRQARLQGRRDGRDGLRRPPHPGRLRAGRAGGGPGQGLAPDPRRPRAGPGQHRGARRRGPGRLRSGDRLRPAAGDVRRPHRQAPGHPVQAGRHGHPAGGGPPAHPFGGREARRRRAGRRRGRHGQAVRVRGGLRERHRGDAHPRRLRLHHRVPRSSATSATPR